MKFFTLALFLPVQFTYAHIAAFADGMYCKDGLPGDNNQNNNLPIGPLYQLSKEDWWFQHDRGCDQAPPADGVFLEIPSGGKFTVEHAANQAFTTLSYNGSNVSEWPDGAQHPEDWHGEWDGSECLPGGGFMHTTNQSDAQGTAFAIAYEADLSKIAMEDLVVFSVLAHTPWHREATYEVPANMPACPESGCTCAYLWVPKDCGQQNMYMQGLKCKVTGTIGHRKLAKAQPPSWCADETAKCRKGAKQMVVFNQAEGNNVDYPDLETPAYNEVLGFRPGAQVDIFEEGKDISTASAASNTDLSHVGTSSVAPTKPSSDAMATSSFLHSTDKAESSSTILTTTLATRHHRHHRQGGRQIVTVTVTVTADKHSSPTAH